MADLPASTANRRYPPPKLSTLGERDKPGKYLESERDYPCLAVEPARERPEGEPALKSDAGWWASASANVREMVLHPTLIPSISQALTRAAASMFGASPTQGKFPVIFYPSSNPFSCFLLARFDTHEEACELRTMVRLARAGNHSAEDKLRSLTWLALADVIYQPDTDTRILCDCIYDPGCVYAHAIDDRGALKAEN